MDYELAKKLKDAGFPNHGDDSRDFVFPNEQERERFYNSEGESWQYAYVPSLSELIKACGDKFGTLWQTPEGIDGKQMWGASVLYDYQYNSSLRGSMGFTAKEAVSKLWIELQK